MSWVPRPEEGGGAGSLKPGRSLHTDGCHFQKEGWHRFPAQSARVRPSKSTSGAGPSATLSLASRDPYV